MGMPTQADVQHLFLQSVLSRRVLSKGLARVLWEKSIDAVKESNPLLPNIPVSDKHWTDFVGSINESLNDLDLEFRSVRDELDGRDYFILVNRKGDLIAQAATNYSATEIAYFKALVEQIMLSHKHSFSISSTAALREVTHVKSMTKLQAEQFLDNLVGSRWLIRSRRGRYSLSSRTILELESYLTSNYPDHVLKCTCCSEILTKGFACPSVGCKGRAHSHCVKTARGKCPSCQDEWPRTLQDATMLIPIGEAAIKNNEEFGRTTRRTGTPSDGDGEEDLDRKPKRKPPKKKGKGKGKAKIVEDSEEEASMSDGIDTGSE